LRRLPAGGEGGQTDSDGQSGREFHALFPVLANQRGAKRAKSVTVPS
jgi:hypothetical protein